MYYPSFEEIRELHQKLAEMRYDYWLNHDLFSLQWWLLLTVFIVPWIIWWKLVDKERIFQILLFGTLLMILVITLDDIGIELNLWSYPYKLFFAISRLSAIDQGILIVAHMFLYQYFVRWKSFLIANVIMALFFSFILEPLTVKMRIYDLENWRYIYSLPIYILKAMLVKWIVDEVIQKKKNA